LHLVHAHSSWLPVTVHPLNVRIQSAPSINELSMHLLAVHRYEERTNFQSVRDLQHDLLGREIGSV